ncbi:MAG: hypothetical protein ACI3XC_05240 [Phascolarctobacterium sp.]
MGKYSLRFISKDNLLCNEIFFADYGEAEKQLSSYRNDSTGLFSYIALFDVKKAMVAKLLHFEGQKCRAVFGDWDIVKLRDGFQESGEENNMYCITNMNESNGHCSIVALNSKSTLGSSEIVGIDMLDFVATKPDA